MGPRLLILPFTNLSGSAGLDSFAGGLTEEIIRTLLAVDIFATASPGTDAESAPLRDLRAQYNAGYALIGSVRNVAVAALTKNLADELGPRGVNVTVVHPGATRTEKTPAVIAARAAAAGLDPAEVERRMSSANSTRRLIDAREVAYVVAFLASPKSVAINGDAIAAGGGAPGAIHY